MSIANPFEREPGVLTWRGLGWSLSFRQGLKIGSALVALGALVALAVSGHGFVAAWLGLTLVMWAFFIGAAKASAEDD